jgi:DNA modification methylase
MQTWQIHCGDALSVLQTLPDESVHCVVTSPPYFGLRDYGTGRWEGGSDECDHAPEQRGGRFATAVSGKQASNAGSGTISARDCSCGAVRIDSQIGLESSPQAYVSALVEIFREARRVLRDDGVCWCNLGDSYAGWGRNAGRPDDYFSKQNTNRGNADSMQERGLVPDGLKPKDLMGIPWRVALALQADGWWLRSDVIWHKKSCMPESVTDRPTRSHEYVFLLTKSARYWYDADAIREPYSESMLQQMAVGYNGEGVKDYSGNGVQNPSVVKARILARKSETGKPFTFRNPNESERRDTPGCLMNNSPSQRDQWQGANARTVWSLGPEPSNLEHFAVMPRMLARRCILAGCPQDGIVFDPFAGSGTSGVVALEEGRNFVGIELNAKYHAIARERLGNVAPLLAQEVGA